MEPTVRDLKMIREVSRRANAALAYGELGDAEHFRQEVQATREALATVGGEVR